MAKRNRAKRRSGKSSAPDSRPPRPPRLSVLKWWLTAFAVLVIASAFGWALSAPRESGPGSMAFPSAGAAFKPTMMNTAPAAAAAPEGDGMDPGPGIFHGAQDPLGLDEVGIRKRAARH